jgi:hypothetical protein
LKSERILDMSLLQLSSLPATCCGRKPALAGRPRWWHRLASRNGELIPFAAALSASVVVASHRRGPCRWREDERQPTQPTYCWGDSGREGAGVERPAPTTDPGRRRQHVAPSIDRQLPSVPNILVRQDISSICSSHDPQP